jgi:hypothetical protein
MYCIHMSVDARHGRAVGITLALPIERLQHERAGGHRAKCAVAAAVLVLKL